MNNRIYQVDAFTSKPFSGNPAGVMILEKEESDEWMALIAREMNLSETAFLIANNGGFDLRWFTPKVEVDLCGHATLAAAHILWEEEYLQQEDTAVFFTASGELRARYLKGWIELDFPAFTYSRIDSTQRISGILRENVLVVVESGENLLVELETEAQVKELLPDIQAIGILPYQGIIVTSVSGEQGTDFVSRYFAPQVGIDEDPVTGSAHSSLGPYWAEKLEKIELQAKQVSARGGELRLRVTPDRVFIKGQALTIFQADLKV